MNRHTPIGSRGIPLKKVDFATCSIQPPTSLNLTYHIVNFVIALQIFNEFEYFHDHITSPTIPTSPLREGNRARVGNSIPHRFFIGSRLIVTLWKKPI
ncbi:hypothetical protein V2O64_17560 [Verrucomicrobiaceae bacterium 227]